MSTRRGLAILAVLIVLVIVGFAVTGCAAAKPACPTFQSKMLVSDDENETFLGIWFDPKNSMRLAATVKGLAEGTCRLAPPGSAL